MKNDDYVKILSKMKEFRSNKTSASSSKKTIGKISSTTRNTVNNKLNTNHSANKINNSTFQSIESNNNNVIQKQRKTENFSSNPLGDYLEENASNLIISPYVPNSKNTNNNMKPRNTITNFLKNKYANNNNSSNNINNNTPNNNTNNFSSRKSKTSKKLINLNNTPNNNNSRDISLINVNYISTNLIGNFNKIKIKSDKKENEKDSSNNNYNINSIEKEKEIDKEIYNSIKTNKIFKKSKSINKFGICNSNANNKENYTKNNLKEFSDFLKNNDEKEKYLSNKKENPDKLSYLKYNEFDLNYNYMSDSNPVKVIVRFRPMNDLEEEMLFRNIGGNCVEFKSIDTIEVTNQLNALQTFTFDRAFDPNSTQSDIFEQTAKPLIDDVLKGYNATIFTYGQSGSGKTYTMYGEDFIDENAKGIIPRAVTQIFEYIDHEKNKDIKFELKFSMLEIYKENIYDLLNIDTRSQDLKIKEHKTKGIYVENLSEIYISSQEELIYYIVEAEKLRSVSETSLNKNSSRSHLLFQLQITQKLQDDTERRGFLNLVDLAGSEKVSKTNAIGDTLEEAKKINLSLSNLGNVIFALASNQDYVPYRDSKLTRILQDSLGGNSKTLLIVACSIHSYNSDETLSTLKFAKRAKKIKNKVRINIKHSTEQLESIIEYLSYKLKLAEEKIEKLQSKRNISEISNNTNNTNNNNRENSTGFFSTNLDNNINFDIFNDGNSSSRKDLISEDKNINSTLENNNESNAFDKERLELENTILRKDREIEELKSEINSLKIDNNNLKDKFENILKDSNIEKYIDKIEISMKEFIKDLSNAYDNVKDYELSTLKENFNELKNFQIENERKYMDIIKDLSELREQDINIMENRYDKKNDSVSQKFFSANTNNILNNNNIKEKEKENINILKDYDLHTEKEVALFDNFNLEDEMNMSMNTFRLDRKDTKRNMLKFTCKRNPSENNINNNNNIQSDLISNISFNTCNKEKGNFLNMKNNNKNPAKKLDIPTHNNPNEYKSISDKQISNNFKKKNSFGNNNIIVIENLSQNEENAFPNQKNNNKTINTNSNYNINNNIFSETLSNNNNNFFNSKKSGNLNFNKTEDFNLNSEELFKKYENIFKAKESKEKENLLKFHKSSEELFSIGDSDNKNKLENLRKRLDSELSQSKQEEENNSKNPNESEISSNLILSYRKIFSNNKFFAKKIMEDFLKKTENEVNNLSKIEENNIEASVLYNIKSNNNEDNLNNKSTIKINNNINENASALNDDFCSVNKNLNLDVHNTTEEKIGTFCNKNYNKIKNGFINSTLKAIYYEKINLELLSKILLDLKIFHEESEYRKKLKSNFPKFINIFEDYLHILEELKKIKFRREKEKFLDDKEKEKSNANSKSISKERKLTGNNSKIRNHRRRISADSLIKVNKFDFIEETSDLENKVLLTSENNIDEENSNNNYYKNISNFGSININKKKSNPNLIKSISNKKSALQTNLTFNNYNLHMSNRITFSNNGNANNENSCNNYNIPTDFINMNIICPSCNKTFKVNNNNNINSTKSFTNKENPQGNVAPFKLFNNNNNENNNNLNLHINTEEREYFNYSPEKSNKFPSNLNLESLRKESENLLSYSKNNNKNPKSPEKENNNKEKEPKDSEARKYTFSELNNINSFSNTPLNNGFKTFNLNNSNLNGSNVKGKLENFRGSNISISSNKKNNQILPEENFYFNELVLIKKENILYKNCFDSLTNEYNNFKLFEKNKEEAILKFYDENKVIFDKEVNCFWKALKVYKEIFKDSISIKENKISEMSKVFDDMVIGENSILLSQGVNNTMNNLHTIKDTYTNFQTDKSDTVKLKEDFLKNLAIKRKNSVIKGENENKDREFLKLAEAFYKEEGTATKKLDYVSIQMNNTNDAISLKYGSGLNKNIPTRSPLYKGFNNNPLKGDDDEDFVNDS